jgi:dTDP-4-dehydrorhamnose 3,5-epimerase
MPFKFKESPLKDVIIIDPEIFGDSRGSFRETYKKSEFHNYGITVDFIQDNYSISSKGVLRGIHFQSEPYSQAKLIRITSGSVFDIAIDLRKNSPNFGKWFGIELSVDNGTMLYIPEGFGHGFLTLEDNTHFQYKCSQEYNGSADGGIYYNDPDIAIEWPKMDYIISDKDMNLPLLKDI